MNKDVILGAIAGVFGFGVSYFLVSLYKTPNFWAMQAGLFIGLGVLYLLTVGIDAWKAGKQ